MRSVSHEWNCAPEGAVAVGVSAALRSSELPLGEIYRGEKSCDLCGGREFIEIAAQDRHGEPLATDLCQSCGLVMHHSIPTASELARFYGTEYRAAYHGELTPSPRRVMRAWKNGQRIFRLLRPFLAPGAAVLEIGAGIGCTVAVFSEQGYRAEGIEPNDGFQKFSQEELRATVRHAQLQDLPANGAHDLVLLVHVIEHLRSPRSSLEQIRELLQPGGRLYVECPNLGAPFATRGRLFHYAHIFNFTRSTLAQLAVRCGYEVEAWLTPEHDPNLAVVLRRVEVPGVLPLPPGSAATRAALERYNAWSYHARPGYLWSRCCKLASYGWEYLTAGPFVRKLLAGRAAR